MAQEDLSLFIQQFAEAVSVLNVTISEAVILILLFLIGMMIGKLLGRLVNNLLHEIKLDKRLKLGVGHIFSLEKLASGVVSWFFYLAAFLLVLNRLGVLKYVVNTFVTVVGIVIILVILLGMKDVIPNIVAGIKLRKHIELRPGRKIVVGHVTGMIEEATWTTIHVKGSKGGHIMVPYVLASKEMTIGKKKR